MDYTGGYKASLIRSIYNGRTGLFNLPKKLYTGIAEHLFNGVKEGMGINIARDIEMIEAMRVNVFLFSGAKTFNYVLSTQSLIVENNEIVPFSEFKKRAAKEFELYNETYLKTEYETAIGQAQSARAWNSFSEDAVLTYMTSKDAHVSNICKSMEGVTRAKKDPIWNTNAPMNHYLCRCYLDASYDNKEKRLPENMPTPPEGFNFNPGIKQEIFPKTHPYFNVPKQYVKLAKRNFDLPIKPRKVNGKEV